MTGTFLGLEGRGYALDEQGFRAEGTGGPCSALVCAAQDQTGETGTLVVHRDYTADLTAHTDPTGTMIGWDTEGVFVGWYAGTAWEDGDEPVRWVRGDGPHFVRDALLALLDCAWSFDSQTDPTNDPNGYTTWEVQA